MTRLTRGPGTEALRREYVYSDPPISVSDLAAKYGLARSNVAQKCSAGGWTEEREAFRGKLREGVIEALSEKWVEARVAYREKLLAVGGLFLDQYAAMLEADAKAIKDAPEGTEVKRQIPITTKDMIGLSAMLRDTMNDALNDLPVPGPVVNPETGDVSFSDPDEARRAIAQARRLMAGSGDAGDAGA